MSEWRKTEIGKAYFLTFTIVNWIDVFIRREYQEIVLESLAYCQAQKGLKLYAFCLMPSHMHLIAMRESGEIRDVIRDMKAHIARQTLKAIEQSAQESREEWMLSIFRAAGFSSSNNEKYQFWQDSNHPFDLFTHDMIEQKTRYIHENPVKAGFVEQAEHYRLSSASPYCPVRVLDWRTDQPVYQYAAQPQNKRHAA